MRIAVAGGTGLTGRHVVEALTERGHEPVVLARSTGVDLRDSTGLDAALAGAEAVVDVTNVATQRRSVAVDFFDRAGRHLVAAAGRAGVRHLVTLSIVGVDRVGARTTRANCARRRSSGAARCRGPSCGPPSSTSSPARC
jgi:uncharacterized protein YbjT (DUF2867 family)